MNKECCSQTQEILKEQIVQTVLYSKLKEQTVLLFSSFVHNSSINEHKNIKLKKKKKFKSLIEFYNIGALEIICKRMQMNFF